MSGNFEIDCLDQHLELPPIGAPLMVGHRFRSQPTADASRFMLVQNGHPMTEGDQFKNEAAPDHQIAKTGGCFVNPPSQQGVFVNAGQNFVKVNGRSWITSQGVLHTCSDACPRRQVNSAATPIKTALVCINNNSAVTGW